VQLQFDPQQDFQLAAIAAVADLFLGQPRVEADLRFMESAAGFAAVPNRLDLTPDDLLATLRAVQAAHGITPDDALRTIDQPAAPSGRGGSRAAPMTDAPPASFPNFSVEMETGTGKTYVYLRTALELYRRYGMRKFIVVVPSVAIREGVLKTLQITRRHLSALYDNVPYRSYAYDSAAIGRLRQFALSDGVEIMVMTLAAFNKDANIIRQSTDRLQGETPIHLVQAARPILILDEPQNMESDISRAALASLRPLFALRYSATHRHPYNLVYRLTPYQAYRQGLVKRIEVAAVQAEDAYLAPYVRLVGISTQKRTVTARVAVHALSSAGAVRETTLTVRPGDDLRAKTGRAGYAGHEIEEINPGLGLIRFADGRELAVGESFGADREALFEAQLRYTVETHLRKQARLRPRGVKVLSLFFIDRVANYAPADGVIRCLFHRVYTELAAEYPAWRDLPADTVQAAYFAQRRTRAGDVILEDTRTGEAERDREAYDLIMKDKERLLSLDEPVSFIFSHSALREGWDNPNVFQICTLNQAASEVRKRQEVGRGVRLAVDQTGARVRDPQVNVLTVVANESYGAFVAALQDEIAAEYRAAIESRYGRPLAGLTDDERRLVEAEYGADILPPRPANARDRVTVRLRKAYTLKPEFQALWDKIRQKTRYAVRIDTDRLVRDVVADLEHADIRPPRVTVTKAMVEVTAGESFDALQMSGARTLVDLAGRYPLPNLVEVMADLMERVTPPVRLTRRTLLDIIRRAPGHCRRATVENPVEFATIAVRAIKDRLVDQLVDGIRYEKIGDVYEMSRFETEFQAWEEHLVKSARFDDSDGASLYDHVPVDSDIEREFVLGLEHRNDVRLYIKLPGWFTIDTPIGTYNPDWAIVMDDPEAVDESAARLYLVRETKGAPHRSGLRPDERRKVDCAERHFSHALNVGYRLVVTADDLP
jgi:type III restriction enzyme